MPVLNAHRWILPPPRREPSPPSPFPPLVAALLEKRGLNQSDSALPFLNPRLADLGNPFSLPAMEPAVNRLLRAIDQREQVALYGDYDVDGVSSLALMAEILAAYGITPHPFLPQRMDEGYGLSLTGLERCLSECEPTLIVAIDCGTSSKKEALWLQERGIDLIVLDHHQAVSADQPDSIPIVNPKLGQHSHDLCSAGIVFKVGHALLKSRPLPKETLDLRQHLDLVALATVADLVPLTGENRIFVRHGLRTLATTNRPGLQALKSIAAASLQPTAQDIAFRLGPRLNAAGRLDTASHAFNLLHTRCPDKAEALAQQLNEQNRDRQQIEKSILNEAMEMADKWMTSDPPALVLAASNWHPGVVGIVAARLMRHFHRPTFVIGFDESGLGKGSGRSLPGIDLATALHHCRDHLVKGGGHAAAAGLSIHPDSVDAFRDALTHHLDTTLDRDLLQPQIEPEVEALLHELDLDLLEAWRQLEPFGMGNREPLLLLRNIQSASPPRWIKDKHWKARLTNNGCQPIDAIWFNADSHAPLPPPPWDIAATLSPNEWQGRLSLQLQIKAMRATNPQTLPPS